MFEKQGKFYADWRDKKGVRHRKSFTSKRAALTFEAEQKATTHPKQAALRRKSPRYSAPSTSANVTVIRTTKRQSS